MRRPDFDAGGGTCRHCGTRLPGWDTREHCDLCLADCCREPAYPDYEEDYCDDED